jgi:NAD(P)-dependent dehydrogenase (short-subunit alcohol dehydrogenase family)
LRVDESATGTTAELREHGVDVTKVLGDVSTFAGVQGLMDEALNAYGRIDVLVNNVGGTIWIQPCDRYTEEQVHLELERTLYPTLWCCSAVLPIMMELRSGAIVNLGSQSPRGLYRLPYAVGKGGIFAHTKVLSMEYGSYGIRVKTNRATAWLLASRRVLLISSASSMQGWCVNTMLLEKVAQVPAIDPQQMSSNGAWIPCLWRK